MKRFAILGLVLIAGLLFAAGCGGGSSSSGTTAQLRIVNSDAYAGGLDFLVNAATVATDVQFSQSTPYNAVTVGSPAFEVRNTGTTTDILDQPETMAAGSSYTFVVLANSAQTGGAIFTDTTTAATSGNIQLRIINGADALGPMDVYITSPGVSLYSVSANISGLGFGTASGYQTMAAGNYEVRITTHGQKNAVWLDLNETYASGAVLTIVVQDNGGGGLPCTHQELTDATS